MNDGDTAKGCTSEEPLHVTVAVPVTVTVAIIAQDDTVVKNTNGEKDSEGTCFEKPSERDMDSVLWYNLSLPHTLNTRKGES